jgi:hypothetical protein
MSNIFNEIRVKIKQAAAELKVCKAEMAASNDLPALADKGEVLANLTLAYRHLEDASMRVGKAIQAYDGGASVYDKETTVGA